MNVGQIEEARHIADISAVQVELSVWHDENLLNGVVQYCITHDIQLIAYRPLGGARRVRQLRHETVLREVAESHGATPAEIALAWLDTVSGHLVSIPGPTRVETVQSVVRAHSIHFNDEERQRLDARFLPGGSSAFARATADKAGSSSQPRDGEVVLIMGLPGAGKSTAARTFVDEGYARLNRDDAGGSLQGLLPDLQRLVEEGRSRIVLDNTYMSRASRARVRASRQRIGASPARCVWVATSVEDAQVNAVSANHRQLRTSARTGGNEAGGQARHQCIRTVRAVPPSA